MTGTRDRIVFAAMDLFHRQGYEATSISDVLAAADANAGSLYHFFPGKDALLLAVLDAYLAGLWPVVMAPRQGAFSHSTRVQAMNQRPGRAVVRPTSSPTTVSIFASVTIHLDRCSDIAPVLLAGRVLR